MVHTIGLPISRGPWTSDADIIEADSASRASIGMMRVGHEEVCCEDRIDAR